MQCVVPVASGQESTLPAVPDSPTCQQQLEQVEQLLEANVQGASRIIETVLMTPSALVHRSGDTNLYIPVRLRVIELIREHAELRAVWTSVAEGRAKRSLREEGPRFALDHWPGTTSAVDAAIRLARDAVARGAPAAAGRLLRAAMADPAWSDSPSQGDAIALLKACDGWNRGAESTGLQGRVDFDDAGLQLEPSWSGRLDHAPSKIASAQAIDRADGLDTSLDLTARGSFRSMLPVASDRVVIVNTGEALFAFDAITRESLWSVVPPIVPKAWVRAVNQLTMVTTDHGVAYAVVGLLGTSDADPLTGIVAARVSDGMVLWAVPAVPTGNEGGLDGSSGYGAPIAVDDLVVVALRRTDSRNQTTEFLVGLDAATGNLRWSTSLGTASGLRSEQRTLTQPSTHDGAIFVSTGAGTIGCVDAATGQIEWLRRLACPVRITRVDWFPWDMPSVFVKDNRLLLLAPEERSLLEVDATNGVVIRETPIGPGTPSGAMRYILPIEDGFVAVGQDVIALSTACETRRWSRCDLATSANRCIITGRVRVVQTPEGEALLVPTVDGIELTDTRTGAVRRRFVSPSGNPTAAGASLFVASDDLIIGWTPSEEVRTRLQAAVLADPADFASAAALLELAVRGGGRDVGRQACQAILRATELRPPTEESMNALLATMLLAETTDALERSRIDDLYRALAACKATSEVRVTAMLSNVSWLARSGRAKGAGALLWSIATDDSFRLVTLERDGCTVRVPIHAIAQLQTLVRAGSASQPLAKTDEQRLLLSLGLPEVGGRAAELESLARTAENETVRSIIQSRFAQTSPDGNPPLTRSQEVPLLDRATALPGQLIPAIGGMPNHEVLYWFAGKLQCFDQSTHEARWSITTGPMRPESFVTGNRLVLLNRGMSGAVSFSLVDIATGESLGESRVLAIAPTEVNRVGPLVRPPAVARYVLNGIESCVVYQGKSIARLDFANPDRFVWAVETELDSIDAIVCTGPLIWVVGTTGKEAESTVAMLAINQNGKTCAQTSVPFTSRPSQISMVDGGTVALSSPTEFGVFRWQAEAITSDWIVHSRATGVTKRLSIDTLGGWIVQWAAIQSPPRRALDGVGGIGRFEMPPTNGITRVALVRGQVLIQSGEVLRLFSIDGQLEGEAIIPRAHQIVQWTVDGPFVCVLTREIHLVGPLGGIPITKERRTDYEIGWLSLRDGLRWSGEWTALSLPVPPDQFSVQQGVVFIGSKAGTVMIDRIPSAPKS